MNVRKVEVYFNNIILKSDVPSILHNGVTLVPIRTISEKLGAEVNWNPKTQEATIKTSTKIIKLKINSSEVNINGKIEILPDNSPARLVSTQYSNGASTMVPLRFISETLGYEVNWDGVNRIVKINVEEEIKIKNQVKSVGLKTINGKQVIAIENTAVVKYNAFYLGDPERVVIDVLESSIVNTKNDIKTDKIKGVRISQFNKDTVRIVVDISDNYKDTKFQVEVFGDMLLLHVDAIVGEEEIPNEEPEKKPEPPTENVQKVIVVDAGHGGNAPGASSEKNKEKDLTLKVALKLEESLKQLGYRVIMTRSDDSSVSLADRAKIANDNNVDAFVSIHFNSTKDKVTTASGIETYYTKKQDSNVKEQDDFKFAESIQKQLIKELKERDRGTKHNTFAVTKNTKMLAALVELGFINNPKDELRIETEEYLSKSAQAIAEGIHGYFSK